MINYFIPLLVYLSVSIFVTLLYAGKHATFTWKRFIILIIATPLMSMAWLELLKDRGQLRIENLMLLEQNIKLKKKIKLLEKI
jgi:hypothetical protein